MYLSHCLSLDFGDFLVGTLFFVYGLDFGDFVAVVLIFWFRLGFCGIMGMLSQFIIE